MSDKNPGELSLYVGLAFFFFLMSFVILRPERIDLMGFAFGSASVFFLNGILYRVIYLKEKGK